MKPVTRSDLPEFIDQKMISNPVPSSLSDFDLEKLKSFFPENTIFRPHDPNLHADHRSDQWICFPEFPFTLGLRYPFPDIISDFFGMTGMCYSQTMPMIWRTLFVIHSVNKSHHTRLGINDIALNYHLRSHGSNYFLLKVKPKRPHLVLCATQNTPKWKERFFFVHRKSLPEEELIPTIWLTKAVFEKLAPPFANSEELIQKFLQIPESIRTFSLPSLPMTMKSDKAPSASAVSYFSLSDIDDEDIPIRTEKSVSELVMAQNPNLCIKSTTKKRKAVVSEGPDEPFLDVEQAVEQILMRCREKDELIESMKRSASVAAESAAAATQKIISLRKEIKDSEAYAAQKDVDAQRKQESMIAAFKKDATIAVLKARILMASEASSIGQDISLWDLEAWMDKLAKLKGEDPEARNFFDCSSGKALKSSTGEASKVSAQKIPIQIDDAEMDNLGQSEETPEEQTAAGGSNSLGKEGK